MQYQITLREVNQNFARYIKVVEVGNEIIITRHGLPVARIIGIPPEKTLSSEQKKAKLRVLAMMKRGLHLGGEQFKREDLHDR